MKEIWKPVKGYEGYYEVSNLGRIKALTRTVQGKTRNGKPCPRIVKEHIMHQPNCTNGYKQIALSKDSEVKMYRVHRIVAEAFLDNPKNYPEVNHIDEDKTNNCVTNLEWCSHAYNQCYGNKPAKGERNGMARLTAAQVREIRRRRENGEKLKDIAVDYDISINHVCNISKGTRWKHEALAD